jgi:hypothetical protein
MVIAKKICERDLDVNKTEKVTMLEEIWETSDMEPKRTICGRCGDWM